MFSIVTPQNLKWDLCFSQDTVQHSKFYLVSHYCFRNAAYDCICIYRHLYRSAWRIVVCICGGRVSTTVNASIWLACMGEKENELFF